MSTVVPTFKVSYFFNPRLCDHGPVDVSQLKKVPRYSSDRYCSRSLRVQESGVSFFKLSGLRRAYSDGGHGEIFAAEVQSSASLDLETSSADGPSSSNYSYLPLFIHMLGLDNDHQDREQAAIALWKYSLGGKQCVDNIMKYGGTLNLIVNLLKSDTDTACEAAAGLLRIISSINLYRESVAESGAIEGLADLLARSALSSDVKEQTLCTLWNLAVDEKLSSRISQFEILALVVKCLDDEDSKVKEAAGGVLANLALSRSSHKKMVEAGVIQKLAKLLTAAVEESKVTRKVAKNALLELAKDDYNRLLIMDEGLVLVPLVGATAYKTFKPALYSWPSLPDGTTIEQRSSKAPSRYGASELLVGLNLDDKNAALEDLKVNAVIGRTQQRFLARIGAIELEDDNKSKEFSASNRLTLLPWIDAVARLVLILELEDHSAVARAAVSIAEASINEHMRLSFKEAGAVRHLVRLINHPDDSVKLAVTRALDSLSISINVCQTIEGDGVLYPLINLLKQSKPETSHSLRAVIVSILSRILDPNKEMKSKFYDGPINESRKEHSSTGDPGFVNGEVIVSSDLRFRPQTIFPENLFDSSFISCLVKILKTSKADLQRKVASILEFIMVIEPSAGRLVSAGIESGLEEVFRQRCLAGLAESRYDTEGQRPEVRILELEEGGLAISASARLLMKLLDYEEFCSSINSNNLIALLRAILVSSIPLENKNWVAACLVKLSSLSGHNLAPDSPVKMEVTLYETIPRLMKLLKGSFPPEAQEIAVLELNRIISEGLIDSTRAVASEGGIFPLVKLMESGTDRAVEASLAILYNLSMESENHAALIAAGTVPVLKKIVLSERPPWTCALRLLRTLPT